MYVKFNQFVRFPACIFSVKFQFHYYSFFIYLIFYVFYFGRLIREVATRVELDASTTHTNILYLKWKSEEIVRAGGESRRFLGSCRACERAKREGNITYYKGTVLFVFFSFGHLPFSPSHPTVITQTRKKKTCPFSVCWLCITATVGNDAERLWPDRVC